MYREARRGARVRLERGRLVAVVEHLDGSLGRGQDDLGSRPGRGRHRLANVECPLHRVALDRVDVKLPVQTANRRVLGFGVEG
jgi:hypothetical protein